MHCPGPLHNSVAKRLYPRYAVERKVSNKYP